MVTAINTSETWYEETASRGDPSPSSTGTVAAEICVIGGGLAGITCATELARRGKRVVLLEARRLAWGASGRNGGFVSNGFAAGLDEIAARTSLDHARALYRLSAHGSEYVRREISRLDATALMGEGMIVTQRVDDEAAMQKRRDVMAKDFATPLDYLSTEETRVLLRTERYFQSLRNPASFHIHPLRYALALAESARASGAIIHENDPALAVESKGAAFIVRTRGGAISAEHVIHCVSALDRRIHPPSGRAVLPVATYVAVTAPLEQDAILTRAAIADTRRAGDYYRLIGGGRILWGGRITTRTAEPRRLAETMKRDMLSVYPQLGDPAIARAWPGLMGYALHKMPLIGRARDGQWFATAFGGHGLNTTAMAGLLFARAIADGDDEYRRFEAFAPRWAGGPFGRAGVQATYWWLKARDMIDEARAQKKARRED
jgi:glycine/D-amino acid oxidase-like deaminating enzyme